MIRDIHLFNTDSDMAVANNSPFYMPPARIEKMNRDLGFLAAYFASEDDAVLMIKRPDKDFLKQITPLFGYTPQCYSFGLLQGDVPAFRSLRPWGWNPRIHQVLAPAKPMMERVFQEHPMFEWSDYLREISGKGVVVKHLPRIIKNIPESGTAILPRKITSVDDLEALTKAEKLVVKAPWSSSGKGVRFMLQHEFAKPERDWTIGVLRQQGFITAARYVHNHQDFAMQFYASPDGQISYCGLSLFFTNAHGQYQGNYIASDEELKSRLSKLIDPNQLDTVRDTLLQCLPDILKGHYYGYFGIDMMLFNEPDDPQIRIHPMVEINLRNNMGILAAKVRDKIVEEGRHGKYVVDFEPTPELLKNKIRTLQEKYPLEISSDRIKKGFFPLTPLYPDAQYIAYIIIE
ncbi:MAG: hypothetical protein ACRC9Q_09960 [Bacteroidales bacterium]